MAGILDPGMLVALPKTKTAMNQPGEGTLLFHEFQPCPEAGNNMGSNGISAGNAMFFILPGCSPTILLLAFLPGYPRL